jgi:hypothetical protein
MTSSGAHRSLAASAILATFAACSTPPPVPSTPALPQRASANAPEASTDAGAPDAAAPTPPPLIPRTAIAGNTRGSIACGDRRCDASREICAMVAGPAWACVPRGGPGTGSASYECDDGTDCPQGKTCCQDFSSDAEYYVCTTRNVGCSVEVCVEGGARCPPGQLCKRGVCAPEKDPLPKCGSGVTCSVEKPVCVWKQGKGECVSAPREIELEQDLKPGSEFALLRCTQNADCGSGFHCCTAGSFGASLTYCALNCDAMSTAQFCVTDADCPKLPGATLKCLGGIPGLPAWSKLCSSE